MRIAPKMERKGTAMFFKKIANATESKSFICFNPHIEGCYYHPDTQEELLFNKKEIQAMLDLSYLAGAANNYRDIFYSICRIAFECKNLTFKNIMNGIWKEVQKAYINNKEEYNKEIQKEERGYFIDEDGFYHHSLKEYRWHRAITDGIIAYETKMGL